MFSILRSTLATSLMLLGLVAGNTGCNAMASESESGGAGGGDDQNCTPGDEKDCHACDGGYKVCNSDGSAWSACYCPGNTGGSGGSAGGSGGAGGNTSTGTTTSSGAGGNSGVAVDGTPCPDGTVTYTITAKANLAESLRVEGGTTSLNATGKDTDIDPDTGKTVVTAWDIVPPGEQYANQATWTFKGCAGKSFRHNVRGWSSQPIEGAPNKDAYACTLYWVNGLSPDLTESCTKADGSAGKLVKEPLVVNAAPKGDGRSCSMHCE